MHAAELSAEIGSPLVTGGETAAPWPVDLIHLRRYTMGDQQLEREVLGLFAGELPKTVASLRAAATDRDWKMASHTLKGSARAVGAWHLARVAMIAERHPEAVADADLRRNLIETIDGAVSEAVGYIRSLDAAA